MVSAVVPRDTLEDAVEVITDGIEPLAYIIRSQSQPDSTVFLTPRSLSLQLGMIVHEANSDVPRHFHRRSNRTVEITAECVVIRRGSCEVSIYNDQAEFVASRLLETGDVALLVGGGHGFHMIADTVLVEVKQGPYMGVDKVFF